MEYNEVHFPFGGAFPATAERTAGRRSGGPYAPVMELVDMRDLGSRAATRAGSSPFRRTISERNPLHSVSRRPLLGGRLETAFRSFAPPLHLEPAALGFEVVLGA